MISKDLVYGNAFHWFVSWIECIKLLLRVYRDPCAEQGVDSPAWGAGIECRAAGVTQEEAGLRGAWRARRVQCGDLVTSGSSTCRSKGRIHGALRSWITQRLADGYGVMCVLSSRLGTPTGRARPARSAPYDASATSAQVTSARVGHVRSGHSSRRWLSAAPPSAADDSKGLGPGITPAH